MTSWKLIELGELIEKYGFNRNHHQIQDAAEYFFSCQTSEGDFRGIYGNMLPLILQPLWNF